VVINTGKKLRKRRDQIVYVGFFLQVSFSGCEEGFISLYTLG
jgi:hypothetical protein